MSVFLRWTIVNISPWLRNKSITNSLRHTRTKPVYLTVKKQSFSVLCIPSDQDKINLKYALMILFSDFKNVVKSSVFFMSLFY